MNLRVRLITFFMLVALTASTVLAQLPVGFRAPTPNSPLKIFFDAFSNPWVILFLLFALGWSLFYMMYRLGLEKSNAVPTNYQHKLAVILAFMSITPLLWFYSRNPDAAVVVRAFMQGWPGFMITLSGGMIVGALTYYCCSGWWTPGGGARGGAQ